MQIEDKIPIEERFLWSEGKISRSSFELIKAGLPSAKSKQSEILFVGYSYDIPVRSSFNVIFPRFSPQKAILCESRIVAVTQQFGMPLDVIPNGWKTICLIEFPQGIPDIITNLPTINSWGENKDYVCICNEDTLKAIKKFGV